MTKNVFIHFKAIQYIFVIIYIHSECCTLNKNTGEHKMNSSICKFNPTQILEANDD